MGKVSEKLGPSSTRIVGLLCIVAAGFIFSVAFGWLQTDKYAPDWIIVLFGIAFLAAGLFVWALPRGKAQRSVFSDFVYNSAGTIIFVAFAIISHWIAFGPGERQSESNLSLPIGWLDRHAGDLETRIFFGFGAVVLDLLILRGLFHLIQERRLRRRG
jgi:hypothetical protein